VELRRSPPHACIVFRHKIPSRPGVRGDELWYPYKSRWDRAGSTIHVKQSQLIYSCGILSKPSAAHHTHEQLNLSVDQIIIMAINWQKMALLAVASLLHVGIIQLRAEASVSGSQQQQLQIDKYPNSVLVVVVVGLMEICTSAHSSSAS